MRPIALLTLTLAVACAPRECEDDETPNDDTPVESGCVPYAPVTETWTVSGELTWDDNEVDLTADSRGERGPGTLSATLTWDSYPGSMQLIGKGSGWLYSTTDTEGGTEAGLVVAMENGETLDLTVGEASSSSDPADYPVPYTITYTWTDIVDCWEDNDREADARDVPLDETHEAYAVGSFMRTTDEAGTSSPRDDFYRITVPEGASSLTVDLAYPESDLGLEAVVYAPGEDPNSYVENIFGDPDVGQPEITITREVTPGTWYLRIRDYAAQPAPSLYEGGATLAGTVVGRPPEWDTPYTFRVEVD